MYQYRFTNHNLVGGFGASFSTSYAMWVFFRWVMAFGSLGMKTSKCIMGVEMVGGKWRSIVMIGFYHVRFSFLLTYCITIKMEIIEDDRNANP